jgi:hemin uptake protein HemP
MNTNRYYLQMHQKRSGSATPASTDEPTAERTIPVRELLGETSTVRLEHDGAIYLLRVTRNGKLILTK